MKQLIFFIILIILFWCQTGRAEVVEFVQNIDTLQEDGSLYRTSIPPAIINETDTLIRKYKTSIYIITILLFVLLFQSGIIVRRYMTNDNKD